MERTLTSVAIAAVVLILGPLVARAGPSGPVRALACAPGRAEVAAALVGQSVWTTADGGHTWTRSAVLPELLAADEDPIPLEATGLPASERAVIPDNDSSSQDVIEEEYRVHAPELAVDLEYSNDSIQRDDPSRPRLAVGDSGEWAVLLAEHVYLGGPGRGVRRTIRIENSRWVYIDGRGGVWITVADGMLRFSSIATVAPRRFPLFAAGLPVRGADPDQVLIPTQSGVAIARLSTDGDPRLELVRIGSISAVAVGPDGSWVVAERGRIKRRAVGGMLEDLGPVPGRTSYLLIDRHSNIWLQTASGVWYRRGHGNWRATTNISTAVDASGQVWTGTSHGPIAPSKLAGPSRLSREAAAGNDVRFLAGAMQKLDRELGQPPCRRIPFNPLPRAELVAGAGHGSTREIDLPEPLEQAELRTWVYVEFKLTWSFGPIAPVDCVQQLTLASEIRQERLVQVGALVNSWRRTTATADDGEIGLAIDAMIERERLAELIRIASGVDPRKEER